MKIQERMRLVILRIPNNNVKRSGCRRVVPSNVSNLSLKRSLHLSLLEDKLINNLLPSNERLRSISASLSLDSSRNSSCFLLKEWKCSSHISFSCFILTSVSSNSSMMNIVGDRV
ncbi:unnamed protein product [Lathyrus oleraceus]